MLLLTNTYVCVLCNVAIINFLTSQKHSWTNFIRIPLLDTRRMANMSPLCQTLLHCAKPQKCSTALQLDEKKNGLEGRQKKTQQCYKPRLCWTFWDRCDSNMQFYCTSRLHGGIFKIKIRKHQRITLGPVS